MEERKKILAKIEQNQTDRQRLIDEGEKLTSELSALDKPKLRHGDVFADNICVVTIGKDLGGRWIATHKDGSQKIGDEAEVYCHIRSMSFVCNPSDDLKAMSEDLEEFTVDNGCGQIFHGEHMSGVWLKITTGSACYNIDEVEEIILKLRQVVATAKRKQQDA